jgi:regulator of RNase E activity RraA
VVRGYLDVSVPTVVDRLDYSHGIHSWMRHAIKPLERRRIAGQAVTVLLAPSPGGTGSLDAYFAAVDSCGPGRIFCLSNGEDLAISCMGDLVAAALVARGAEGAVMDGAVRDIAPMLEMGLGVFAASVSPVNFADKQTVAGTNIPIQCGGVPVRPGDVLLADWDGVVVIPHELAAQVLAEAREVEDAERNLRERILREGAVRTTAELFAEE